MTKLHLELVAMPHLRRSKVLIDCEVHDLTVVAT